MNVGDKIKHAGKTWEAYYVYPNTSDNTLMVDFKEVQENAYRNAAGPHQEGDVYREDYTVYVWTAGKPSTLASTVTSVSEKHLLARDGKPWK